MHNEKNSTGEPVAPQWIEEQCARFEQVLAGFTAEMRAAFRKRAAEGRHRWEDPAAAERLQMDLLSHAYYKPLCAGEEAHVANFAAFLWNLRQARERERIAAVAATIAP